MCTVKNLLLLLQHIEIPVGPTLKYHSPVQCVLSTTLSCMVYFLFELVLKIKNICGPVTVHSKMFQNVFSWCAWRQIKT